MSKSSPRIRFALIISAFFVVSIGIWIFKLAETPPWHSSQTTPSAKPGSPALIASEKQNPEPFRFLNHNVRNWLISSQTSEKKPESKAAIIRIISNASPDVVGLCEIGSENDVSEIQSLLKNAGLNLPHTHYTGGIDPIRHLAIISKYPIISSENPEIAILGNSNFSMQRGILDVTVQIGSQPVRFIGLHLKSKRVVPQFNEALLRAEEAQHVRKYIDSILTKDPDAKLVLYGDFNDHIRSPSTRALLGTYRSPKYLTPVSLKDSRGETWTHFYDAHDTYSRIDFIAVSKSLRSRIDRKQSFIIDDAEWNLASDHRALLVTFK